MEIAQKYDRAAPRWDRKLRRMGYDTAYRGFLAPHIRADGPVLDIGTGTGLFAEAWIASGGGRDLTLLDPSVEMLAKAQSLLAQQGTQARTVQLRLEDFAASSAYTTLLSAHVIEHCDDPAAALALMSSWLKPGGRLFLAASSPHWCNWLIWLRYRHRWFAPKDLIAMANGAGLRHAATHQFTAGPPSRTSLGYIFLKPESP